MPLERQRRRSAVVSLERSTPGRAGRAYRDGNGETGARLGTLEARALSQPGGRRYPGRVRILFTFIGGSGHFHPLIPVARAAEAAGHTVAVAGAGTMVPAITAAGLTAFATSEPRRRTEKPERMPLLRPDPEREDRDLRENFARRGARRHAAAILELARTWQPDVLVRGEVDFGTAIAAECLAIPCATVLVLAAGASCARKSLPGRCTNCDPNTACRRIRSSPCSTGS